ncbi:MAG: hypothetical protein A2X99_12095 [Deltaproteobacteria bacterium GWB2_55_19]|nr:MAG: hypothetical protein A2X99_12095 [Deltaproteobacteria bacterium GWB2_55_19]
MVVKVMLAFGNMVFSEGVSRILEPERDVRVVEAVVPGEACTVEKLHSLSIDILLTDFTTLYNQFPDIESGSRSFHIILLDTNCGRDNLVAAILKKKISGVLLGNSNPSLLVKAIKSVAKGEVWIDKQTFKNLLNGINALGKEGPVALSGREKEVVALIGEGFRNKEIAYKLHISEPTVKTHLNRIFQKLNVRTRGELISYAIKNSDVNSVLARQGSV